MKLKKYENPILQIKNFCKDAILNSIQSTIVDDWTDYENKDELY